MEFVFKALNVLQRAQIKGRPQRPGTGHSFSLVGGFQVHRMSEVLTWQQSPICNMLDLRSRLIYMLM